MQDDTASQKGKNRGGMGNQKLFKCFFITVKKFNKQPALCNKKEASGAE
jgi:hypothetical protein